MKRTIYISVGVIIVLASIFLITSRLISGSKAKVGYIFKVDGYSGKYSVFSEENALLGEYSERISTLGLTKGSHKLTFKSINRKPVYIVINPSENKKEYQIKFEVADASIERFTEIIKDPTSYVTACRFFQNDTWAAGYVAADEDTKNSYEIKIYKKYDGVWALVTSGTAIDNDYLISENAPRDLIDYLGSL